MLFLVSLVVDIVALIVTGMCGMFLWNWFVPSVFPAAPQLSLELAMGLSLAISCFVGSGRGYDLEKDEREIFVEAFITQIVQGITKPITFLFLGWVLHVIIN